MDSGAMVCMPPARIANPGQPALYWSMDGPDSMTIVEQNNVAKTMLLMGNGTSSNNSIAGCGKNLSISIKQPVQPKHSANGIGVSAYVYVSANNQTLSQILIKETGNQLQGISVFVDAQYRLGILTTDASGTTGNWTATSALGKNAWHNIEIYLPAMFPLKVLVDGTAQMGLGTTNMSAFGAGTLSFGPALGYLIDEVRIFDLP